MIFFFLFIYIFVVNIVYYVVHIVCEVDVIANSLVLYLPFCSTLNKNFFFFFFFLKVYQGNMLYLSYGRVILGDFSMLYRMMVCVIFLVTLHIRTTYM